MSMESRASRVGREIRSLMLLAFPIMIAQLSNTAIGFVDTVMAGRVSARDLASVALGNSLWVPMFLLMTGVLLATTPKVAQRAGARTFAEIGPLVRQALWLALALGLLSATALLCARPVLELMNVETALIEPSMGYLLGVACGFPAVALYQVLRCFSDGLGHSRPSMVIGLLGLTLNIPLNYIFIYGKLGLPAMGGVGCGWATAIVMWAELLCMLVWVKTAPVYRSSELFARFDWPQLPVIRRICGVGVPIGVAIFAEVSIFSVIALLIGGLGAATVAGHQIALNFSGLTFMIPLALSIAVTVRVGQALGRGDPRQARFISGVGMFVGLGCAGFSASLMFFGRGAIAALYSNDATVIALASSLLVFAALFQFSDAVQVTAAGALRGYQDTRVAMLITLLAYWGIGLPIGYGLGLSDWFGSTPSGPRGLWQGLVVGLSFAALLLSVRLVRSARTRIRSASATP